MIHALKPPCPVCGNGDSKQINFVENNCRVCRIQCEECKTIYFDRRPPYETEYNLEYNQHFYRPGDIRKAGIMAAEIAKIALMKYFGATILEAGTGNGLTIFLLKQMGIYAEGLDIDEKLAEYLRSTLDIKIHVSRFETWKTDLEYSIIYSSHVIEHSDNPSGFLRKALSLLHPGGLLYLETPDIKYRTLYGPRWRHFATRDPYEHITLLSTQGLYSMLGTIGFTEIRIDSIQEYQILRATAEKPK